MPEVNLEDTIAAIATPPGEGGLAVIRISGPSALSIAGKIFRGGPGVHVTEVAGHTVHYGRILDARGEAVDQVLLTVFRAPRSYTGEDTAEISAHGSPAAVRRILDRVIQSGARMAEPGEFTRRAFLNGRMDLMQAEAVVDLIRAKSDRSRAVALRHLEGSLSRKLKTLKDSLMLLYAHMEAFLDFPEEDIEVYSDETFLRSFGEIRRELQALIASFRRGALLREGIRCVLAGRPNVGKSSLFNALLERDRAIVSEFAGTTRDMLEEPLEICGLAVRLMDTAGLGTDAVHPLDRVGMQRTEQALAQADLVLLVVDATGPLQAEDEALRAGLGREHPCIIVANKCDLPKGLPDAKLKTFAGSCPVVEVSSVTGKGVELLEKTMAGVFDEKSWNSESEQITRLRHKLALESACEALARAEEAFSRRESLDIVTLDVKGALDRMSELIGEIYSEDLLDVIFSEFCIGK